MISSINLHAKRNKKLLQKKNNSIYSTYRVVQSHTPNGLNIFKIVKINAHAQCSDMAVPIGNTSISKLYVILGKFVCAHKTNITYVQLCEQSE